jgi:hypothetical protein
MVKFCAKLNRTMRTARDDVTPNAPPSVTVGSVDDHCVSDDTGRSKATSRRLQRAAIGVDARPDFLNYLIA